jgi:hypothetical protein
VKTSLPSLSVLRYNKAKTYGPDFGFRTDSVYIQKKILEFKASCSSFLQSILNDLDTPNEADYLTARGLSSYSEPMRFLIAVEHVPF